MRPEDGAEAEEEGTRKVLKRRISIRVGDARDVHALLADALSGCVRRPETLGSVLWITNESGL